MVYMNLENNIFQGLIKKEEKSYFIDIQPIDFLELYCFPCLIIISQVKPGSWQDVIIMIYQTESVPANLSDYNRCRERNVLRVLGNRSIGPLQFNTGVQKKCPNFGKKYHACVDVVLLNVVHETFIEVLLFQETSPAPKNPWLRACNIFFFQRNSTN